MWWHHPSIKFSLMVVLLVNTIEIGQKVREEGIHGVEKETFNSEP